MKKKKIDTVFADTFTKVRFYSSAISGIKKDNGATICLLYTSPSPRDGLLSRMPSSA